MVENTSFETLFAQGVTVNADCLKGQFTPESKAHTFTLYHFFFGVCY